MKLDLITATEIARDFLVKSGYVFTRLERTETDEAKQEWRLVFDVGLSARVLKTVHINDPTAKVIALE